MSGSSDKDNLDNLWTGAGDDPDRSDHTPSPSANIPEEWEDQNWADPTTSDADVLGGKPAVSEGARTTAETTRSEPGSADVERLDDHSQADLRADALAAPRLLTPTPPLSLVETAFLASAAGLIWLVSYYLSLSPWMRILFPTPIALVYLRWGGRAAWMAAIVTSLLLSVLMGPYLSLLFFIPYGLLGVQLGALWKRGASWGTSIGLGTLVSTLSFFFRVWLLSIFLGEDIWAYLTNRIADFVDWIVSLLVSWNILGIGAFGRPDLTLVQLLTLGAVLLSDVVYLFTVHLGAWVLLNRLGNPIPDPPEWVQVLLEDEV